DEVKDTNKDKKEKDNKKDKNDKKEEKSEEKTKETKEKDAYTKSDNQTRDRKSTRLNSSHVSISYAVFCLKKKHERQSFTSYHIYHSCTPGRPDLGDQVTQRGLGIARGHQKLSVYMYLEYAVCIYKVTFHA